MEDIIRKRINELLKEMAVTPNSISESQTEQRKLNRQINEDKTLTVDVVSKILERIPTVSAEWLLRGEGDMIKNSGVNIGDNNKVGDVANSASHINKNTINVTLPESGDQKIIDSDGRVEISKVDSNKELESLKREYELIKIRYSHLEENIKMKDDLIASQRDTIELLKHKL